MPACHQQLEAKREALSLTPARIYRARHRATTIADRLNVDFALINRNRHKGDRPDSEGRMELLVGDVKDKVSGICKDTFRAAPADPMCDSGFRLQSSLTTWPIPVPPLNLPARFCFKLEPRRSTLSSLMVRARPFAGSGAPSSQDLTICVSRQACSQTMRWRSSRAWASRS
jgi:hypothetical protein